ncbi:PTS sugar transporter subunit IIA [Pseudooceanicola aestuarii]|uniref:PTS sugar transporter subunit IIA n=1 Tax=Pseudooceanicola aestuarii TaxID=2697319 RepID=UPI0013D67EBB|nr:PTS sugar transporter subunit IIA [Pseudooceanicola aestuarii]
MKLGDILTPSAVKVLTAASSKKRLLHEVGELAHQALSLEQGAVVEALMEREALGPTGVGEGVALPHARLDGLQSVQGVFILLEQPVNFDSVDRQPVDLVFALFAPEQAGVEHLKALASVSRTLRDENLRKKLRANRDIAALHALLTTEQKMKAA